MAAQISPKPANWSKIAENEGSTKVQLGMVALQKSNFKDSEKYFREALKISLDSDNKAMALLGMVQIYMNKRDIRAGKDFLVRAKNCKSKNEQVIMWFSSNNEQDNNSSRFEYSIPAPKVLGTLFWSLCESASHNELCHLCTRT